MKIYYQVQMSRTPGYGHRIWLAKTALTMEIQEKMKILGLWGGPDKSDDESISWEFNTEEKLHEAMTFLNCQEA